MPNVVFLIKKQKVKKDPKNVRDFHTILIKYMVIFSKCSSLYYYKKTNQIVKLTAIVCRFWCKKHWSNSQSKPDFFKSFFSSQLLFETVASQFSTIDNTWLSKYL